MSDEKKYQIITFYEFRELFDLDKLKIAIKSSMEEFSVYGTFIIAFEGFNSTVCGEVENLCLFIPVIEKIFETKLNYKSSFHHEIAFQRQKVKIKKEIVTLRKEVNIEKGFGTHVKSEDWNKILNDPETVLLDTRNDYEVKIGTFKGAINPKTNGFNELPKFVEENFDPSKHKKIAMFCTGGIRCEKFAPYLKEQGFEEVYQLDGGILRYLEEIPKEESLWQGECFVFDERITVNENLEKGTADDLSVITKK